MMSGGGEGGYFPSRPEQLHGLIKQAREAAEQQQLDSDVNKLLQDLLVTFNDRDVDKIQARLEKLRDALGEAHEVQQLLFGGSVAKHTFVDGMSDVDALVILSRADLAGKAPKSVLRAFQKSLEEHLTRQSVVRIDQGTLAVTVTYRDGTEIQLLPALRSGTKVLIPASGGTGWNETNPRAFQRAITRANERLNAQLVPTIKLVKSINDGLAKPKQLKGHHIESLCLEAVKGYRGAKTVKALLVHVLEQASSRVLRSIPDVTGQSRAVDSYLGKTNSAERKVASDALSGVARRLEAATSVDQWKTIIEG